MNCLKQDYRKMTLAALLAFSVGIALAESVQAQGNAPSPRPYRNLSLGWGRYWGWRSFYGPGDAISNRIHAQANWVRSVGESAVRHAEAREIRADAFRKEIANSVEYARAYWEKKEIYRAAKMREYTAPLDAADLRNNLTWRRLKDHPELNGPAIVNGKALNFLLDRLSAGLLATHYSLADFDDALLKRLQLSPDVLSKLRLREDVPGGNGLVFQANSGDALDIAGWPFALRDEHFAKQREEFEQARNDVVQAGRDGGTVDNALMKRLLQAHDRLDREFYKYYTKERRTQAGGKYFHQFLTSKRFLQSLAGELARLQELGGDAALDDSTRFDGDNLVALVSHMSRHGLEFAPARQGDESAYHETFYIMRDLYLTSADNNDADAAK